MFALCSSLIFVIASSNIISGFYKNWILSKKQASYPVVKKYKYLSPILNGYPIYHEKFGDALMTLKLIPEALSQYRMALENTSNPDVLSKTAFCYQALKQYTNSEYYYTIVQNMQPYKFYPKIALLKLYMQKSDTIMLTNKAKEILDMKIKVKSQKVNDIRKFADSVLLTNHHNSFNNIPSPKH